MEETLRRCRGCDKLKPLDYFPKNKSCTNGRERTCRICGPGKRNKRWRKNKGHRHTSKIRRSTLIKAYGISPEAYDGMAKEQNDVCKICGNPETRKGCYTKRPRKLAVDHDHSTGRIRGLLCSNCNSALGFAGDNTWILGRMISYIVSDGSI